MSADRSLTVVHEGVRSARVFRAVGSLLRDLRLWAGGQDKRNPVRGMVPL